MRFIYVICFLIVCNHINAQASAGTSSPTPTEFKKNGEKVKFDSTSNDDFMINVTFDNVINGSNDSFYKANIFNPNIGMYFLYDIPLGNTGFSIAPGLGFTFSKTSLDNSILYQDSFGTSFLNTKNHPDFQGTKKTYESSSFYTSWLEVPFELRFKSKPVKNGRSCIKVAAGFRAGVRLAANSKMTYIDNTLLREVTEKTTTYSDLNAFRYGATFRIGYGAFNLFGYYGINQLIKDTKNTNNLDLKQYSIGISITGM